MTPEWYLPVAVSVVLMLLSGVTVYTFARLESGRENAWSCAIMAVALQILMMALWVFAGPV